MHMGWANQNVEPKKYKTIMHNFKLPTYLPS
jgi:hypothetical protein